MGALTLRIKNLHIELGTKIIIEIDDKKLVYLK